MTLGAPFAEKTWTILVVDDDAQTREDLADLLTVEGFSVLKAVNGVRALRLLGAVPGRCLVLLDLDMPVMSGREFLGHLAQLPKALSRFPVLVVSGMADADTVAALPGVQRVLHKPVPPRTLIAAVREYVTPVSRPMR